MLLSRLQARNRANRDRIIQNASRGREEIKGL